jgi:hypothetical protein
VPAAVGVAIYDPIIDTEKQIYIKSRFYAGFFFLNQVKILDFG